MPKTKKVQKSPNWLGLKGNKPLLFLVLFALVGSILAVNTFAAPGGTVKVVNGNASNTYKWGQEVQFDWSTKYTNRTGNAYYNAYFEVVCRKPYNGGSMYVQMMHQGPQRPSTVSNPTSALKLGGVNNQAPGSVNGYIWDNDWSYMWDWSTPSAATCQVSLQHFNKNNKVVVLASLTLEVTP